MFVTAHHWSLSLAGWIQSTPSHSISLGSILKLSFHLYLCLLGSLFPSGFQTIFCIHFSSPLCCYMTCPSHPPWLDHCNNTCMKWQQVKLQFCIFLILRFQNKWRYMSNRKKETVFIALHSQETAQYSSHVACNISMPR